MTRLPTSHLVLAIALLGASGFAHADKTITFNVPVKFEKLDPLVNGFFIICSVWGDQAYPNFVQTKNSTTTSIQNGTYSGTLNVPITVPTTDVGKVRKWSCYLRLTTATTPTGVGVNVPGYPWTTMAPGTTGEVNGTF